MAATTLPWLTELPDLAERISAAKKSAPDFLELSMLANTRLSFLRTDQLATLLKRQFPVPPANGLVAEPIRMAILGSSTTKNLHAGIKAAALRRRMYVDIYEPDFGQYWNDLLNSGSPLYEFQPNVVLFTFDARYLTRGFDVTQDRAAAAAELKEVLVHLEACWARAREAFDALVLQQTVLPIFSELLGQNEHLLAGSKAHVVRTINSAIPERARAAGVSLVAVDAFATRGGVGAWHSEAFWHQAKQEIANSATPLYGDLVMRLVAARYGRSAKCMVLDLDNTLWGGVIGDDGLEGIRLGQGSAEGEAFAAFQSYAKALSGCGIILAVCSKNDEANALAPFERHPDMVLRRADIACFVANWDDKATNIRLIAKTLNIGLDSLVFVDDNPFERNLLRRELPMVITPEIPEDPGLVAQWLADAGFFETIAITAEDKQRTAQYQANATRASLAASVTDMDSYLASLQMRLVCRPFDEVGLPRIAQLINKSNQFNLTTRRYGEDNLHAVIADPNAVGLQLRLIDKFGDNGMIAVLILKRSGESAVIDTWLMSCRVLKRRVEEASLALLVQEARKFGSRRILGQYRPTEKKVMVAGHYTALGFSPLTERRDNEGIWYQLTLDGYTAPDLPMNIELAAGAAETTGP